MAQMAAPSMTVTTTISNITDDLDVFSDVQLDRLEIQDGLRSNLRVSQSAGEPELA